MTNFIEFCTKFRVKKPKFLPCRCTSSLLRSKPVQRNYLHFFRKNLKTVRALRINETKLTSGSAFIFNLFTLESEKESKKDEEPSFGAPHGVLTCLLTFSLRTTPIGVLLDYFSFSHFSAPFCCS